MSENSRTLIKLFGILDITGEVVTMWIILGVCAVVSLVVKHRLKRRPDTFQNLIEAAIEALDNFLSSQLGREKSRKHFSFLATLFIFIIFSNYSGLFPGVGLTDYVKVPTASLSVTAGLGVVTFVFLQYSGIRHNSRRYFRHFITPVAIMLPLLLLDEIIKPISLSLRLFGNVFGEETVLEELYHIMPVGVPVIMMFLTLVFGVLQAVVFTTLVSIYLDEFTE